MSARKPKPRGIDEKSHDLAEHFLSDVVGHTPAHVRELAEAIQDICEGHCSMAEADAEQERIDNGQFGVGA